MTQRLIRDYEVSIWTLQDEFITVLKPSNIEHRGMLIGKDDFVNKGDGTLTTSFSIPMYIYEGNRRIVNPIWHTTKDGTILVDMRKIKVIFNKEANFVAGDKVKDNVFELIITDVQERHEKDELYCDIYCEGLIFHELGKIGYKVSLSSEDFYNKDYDYFSTGSWTDSNNVVHNDAAPEATLQYWVNQFLDPYPSNFNDVISTKWYYEVAMKWGSHNNSRDESKIYDDEYIKSWSASGDILVPGNIGSEREKQRLIDLEESNYYNLTQDIAKTFEVFCRYQYLYDDNYHIIGRKVIFYNNYIQEEKGYLDLTYPYSTSAITRERDSKDLTSKMFVRPVDDEANAAGMVTIMDIPANKSGEDYLLNFDYLYSINAITDEQYAEIPKFEKKMHDYNQNLIKYAENLNTLRDRKIELDAAIKTATDAIPLDNEQITTASALLNNLSNLYGTGYSTGIVKNETNPDSVVLLQDSSKDSGYYYANIKTLGIKPETLEIYTAYDTTQHSLSGQIANFTVEYDEYNNISKITNLYFDGAHPSVLYLTYEFVPKLYYDRVIETWTMRLDIDNKTLSESSNELGSVESAITTYEAYYNTTLAAKKAALKSFEEMMGPALRESYWQPEDYTNYGDDYEDSYQISSTSNIINGDSGLSAFEWDSTLFKDEQDIFYKIKVEETEYPYVYYILSTSDLNSIFNYLNDPANNYNNLCLSFYDYKSATSTPHDTRYLCIFGLGSKLHFGFINNSGNIQPIMYIDENINQATLNCLNNIDGYHGVQLGTITTVIDGSSVSITRNSVIELNNNGFKNIWNSNYSFVYPRIKINSLALKTSSDQLGVKYAGQELTQFEDYYVLPRYNTDDNDSSYYITIKQDVLFKAGNLTGLLKCKFNLSNADTAIYLDAIKVLKENSMPKVSYTIDASVLDEEFLYNDYNKLNYIANINDSELQFENIQGYISELNLNLDKPWEDKIVIKNYRAKFEDLFSSIVAQTQEVKKNAAIWNGTSNAITEEGLEANAFSNTLVNNNDILQAYLNANFDGREVVEKYLREAFNEAGEILRNANSALSNLRAASIENAAILSGFVEDVAAGLTPQVYRQATAPTDFKVGDIWIQTENGSEVARYVATNYSTSVNGTNATSGWTRTYDGTLAAITGAALAIDAQAGTVNVEAENQINIKSGGTVGIAANENVNIVGNKAVNIGGTTINIGSYSSTPGSQLGGIHLVDTVTSNAANATSKVDIDATGIELASSNGIVIKSGAGIDIKSSSDTSTSAVKISQDEGIYLGSSQAITIFSGAVDASGSSANVEMTNSHLLLGVSSGSNGTAAEFTKDKIVLAVGGNTNNITTNSLSYAPPSGVSAQSGVLIQKDYIGLATGSGNNRNVITMNDQGIMLAAAGQGNTIIDTDSHTGSYVRISTNGIDLGSTGNLYLNTNNVQLQTNGVISDGTSNGTRFALGINLQDNVNRDPKLVFDGAGNLSITGKITANSGTIGGWRINPNSNYGNYLESPNPSANSGVGLRAEAATYNGVTYDKAIWAGSSSSNNAPFRVDFSGNLYASNATITGKITATELYIGNSNNQLSFSNGILTIGTSNINGAKTYRQASAPTSGVHTGDIWVDSDDNKMYRYNGSSWVDCRDAQITTNTSSISQNADSISTLVTKTGINSLGTGETLYSEIQQTAEQIDISIGAIQIGGNNLFPQAAASDSEYYHENLAVNSAITPQAGWLIQLPQSTSQVIFTSSNFYSADKIKTGDEYTLSFSYASNGSTSFYCDLYPDSIDTPFAAILVDDSTGSAKRKTITGKLSLLAGSSVLSTLYLRFWRPADSPNYFVDIWDIKLERGNKATAWSPAPEDAEAKIIINKNEISTLVTKTGINNLTGTETLYSKIDQTASDITLAVGSIQGGGTNLFPRSAAINAITNPSYYHKGEAIVNDLYPQSGWNITLPQSESQVLFRSNDFLDTTTIVTGQKYTLSFYYIGFIPSGQSSAAFKCDLYPDAIASPFHEVNFTATGVVQRAVVTGTLSSSSTLTEMEVRFWRPTTSTNAMIKIWDIKFEAGEIATAWSANSTDPVDALESGSSVVINEDEVAISTPVFSINVSGADGDTTYDQTGLNVPVVNSPSVPVRYAGPTSISVDSSQAAADDGSRFRTLSDAFEALSNKWLDRTVTITLATNITETSRATLTGLCGPGDVVVNLNGKTLSGLLGVNHTQQQVEIKGRTGDSGTIGAISYNGNATRIYARIVGSLYIHDIKIIGSGETTGDDSAVWCAWATAYIANYEYYNVRYGLRASNLTNVYSSAGTGNVSCMYHILTGARICTNGTVPTYTTDVSKDATGTLVGTIPGGSGGTTPTPPTAMTTVTLTTNGTKTYQSNGSGWLNDLTLRQGTWGGSFRDIGVISFDFSSLSGATVQSATLTLRRLNGGKGSAITVKATTTNVKPNSGTPTVDTSAEYAGTIGTVNINNTLTCSLPVALVQALISDSTNKKAIALYDNGDISNGNTQNYGVFAGSDNGTYKPTLTITYT